jgi:hypothetical protein
VRWVDPAHRRSGYADPGGEHPQATHQRGAHQHPTVLKPLGPTNELIVSPLVLKKLIAF